MGQVAPEYIDHIEIPDIQNGITKNNIAFFDFPDSAYQLLGKRGMRLLCAEITLFMAWLWARANGSRTLLLVLTFCLLAAALLYQREYRDVRVYKKARKSMSGKISLPYTLGLVDKLVTSDKIYFRDMPGAYSVRKARALLQRGDPVGADMLMEQLQKTLPRSALVLYIRGLCACMLDNEREAVRLLTQVENGAPDPQLRRHSGMLRRELQDHGAPSHGPESRDPQ